MRCNQDLLKSLAKKPGDKEGGLYYKSTKDAYRLRWLKLRGNLLFIFKVPEGSHFSDKELLHVFILEGAHIEEEPPLDQPFLFSIKFEGDGGKKHLFSCQTQQQCTDWVSAISSNSYGKLKDQFEFLRSQVKLKTGKDPVEIKRKNQKFPRRHSSELLPRDVKPHVHSGSSTLSTVTFKKNSATSNYTVGASAFYQSSVPELTPPFKNWETFK